MQTFPPLQSLFPPLAAALLSPWSTPSAVQSCPELSLPLPSPPGRTYGTHFAGDIEEPPVRPPSLPPWRPRRSRASPCPPSVAAPLPGHWAASQSPEPSAAPGRPGGGGPRLLPRGAPRGQPRAPRRPNKAGGGGGGGVRAALPGLSPRPPAGPGAARGGMTGMRPAEPQRGPRDPSPAGGSRARPAPGGLARPAP